MTRHLAAFPINPHRPKIAPSMAAAGPTSLAQAHGTPCMVQLAHPGRMSPAGAGLRPRSMRALCPSEVPVRLGDGWLDRVALERVLGSPREMTVAEIEEAVGNFVRGAEVARVAGFKGCQIHAAHGFLVSQFLSPHTNRRTDDYGGTAEKRMLILRRLVREIRTRCPPPFCVSVKLNSADYMQNGGLQQDEALEQVRWLANCGMVDFIEISGGNAGQASPKMRESTRIREGFFSDFAEKIQAMKSPVPIQLSGGFRSRTGMADAIDSGICDLVGLGRAAVLEPELPRKILLNPDVADDTALGMSHVIRGQWFSNLIPAKVIGGGLPIQFFYYNMRRLGAGLRSSPSASLPYIVLENWFTSLKDSLLKLTQIFSWARSTPVGQE